MMDDPRLRARLAGVFEVIEGTTGTLGQVVIPGMLIIGRDAAATASNILSGEGLFRLGIALALVAVVFHLAWGLLLYDLLRVVSPTVARFSAFILVMSSAVQAVAALVLFAPLVVLHAGESLGAFSTDQLQALALAFLKLYGQANDVFLAFFGIWLATIGYLIFRSTFLPRVIGVALMLEGLGWATFLSPPVGVALFPLIAALGVLGEIPLTLWLLVKGVDPERWREQAIASGHVRIGDAG